METLFTVPLRGVREMRFKVSYNIYGNLNYAGVKYVWVAWWCSR